LDRTVHYRNEIHRFVDGSEQRYRDYPSALREWTVDLSLLDEAELESVADFVRAMQGRGGTFVYTDPISGVEYANCSLAADDNECTFEGELRGRTRLRVRQNRI
jgi:hypothetical protein